MLIAGTKLAIPSPRSIAADFCYAARSVGGTSFWTSREEPVWRVKSLCDYVLKGECDKVISIFYKINILAMPPRGLILGSP